MTALPTVSAFSPFKTVLVDPWSINPLLDDAAQAVPATVAAAKVTNGEPPTLFESGNLPPFLSSGVDPQVLLRLPANLRHVAATEAVPGNVLHLVEEHSNHEAIEVPLSVGWADYAARMRNWLAGKWTNPNFRGANPQAQAAASADLYDSMFGTWESGHQAKLDGVNAADQPRRNARDWRLNTPVPMPGRAQR